jgi:hypothetical protein
MKLNGYNFHDEGFILFRAKTRKKIVGGIVR